MVSSAPAIGPASAASIRSVVESLVGNNQVRYLRCCGENRLVGEFGDFGWTGQSIEVLDEDSIRAALGSLGDGGPLHVLHVDSAAAWAPVSALLARQSVQPWIVIAPAQRENAQLTGSYRHLLFDGTSDVFLADDRLELATNLASCLARSSEDEASISRWRGSALEGWYVRTSKSDALRAQQELVDMRQTLSWRITRPLRAVRRRMPATGTKT